MRWLSPLVVLVRPQKMRYMAERPLHKTKRIRSVLTAAFSLLIAGSLFASIQLAAVALSGRNVVYAEVHDSLAEIASAQQLESTKRVERSGDVTTANSGAPLRLDATAVQNTINSWKAGLKGKASVVIADADTGQKIASLQDDQEYFTASIYKLYVAYIALQDVDAGLHSLSEQFLNGQTRAQCLDNMIRNSDSPCAEKMMNEYKRADLQKRVESLGLTRTSIIKFTTTANDAAHITKMIAAGEGLSQSSTDLLHKAMHLQKYKEGLQNGLGLVTVYDKVGFYEVGWHDSAFVVLPSGKRIVVTVLTQNMRAKQVNDLAQRLQPLFVGS